MPLTMSEYRENKRILDERRKAGKITQEVYDAQKELLMSLTDKEELKRTMSFYKSLAKKPKG